MKIRSAFFIWCVWAGISLPSQAHADACLARLSGWNLSSEGPWQEHGRTKIGKRCGASFSGPGGGYTFKHLFLAEGPQHGAVTLRQGGYYFYTPKPGYVGSDRFMLRVCGTDQNGKYSCANLIINMTISPL